MFWVKRNHFCAQMSFATRGWPLLVTLNVWVEAQNGPDTGVFPKSDITEKMKAKNFFGFQK